MKSIQTATLKPGLLSVHDSLQVYNGLDACLTVEILSEVGGSNFQNIKPAAWRVYNFERAMQAPALEMMLRGWRVDLFKRDMAVARLRKEREKLQAILDEFVLELWDGGTTPLDPRKKTPGLNPASPKQMKEFFYEVLKLPEQFNYAKGQRKLSTNRDSLEKLQSYFHARIFINLIFAIRTRNKLISVLTSEVDPDMRMRTSYNVTGTETGRWSSSRNVFDGGANLQNITEGLRDIFISDPGKKLAYIDKSQAESRFLGFVIWDLFGDAAYLDACESGDLHTYVAKLIWRDLPWTGDQTLDKDIAEQKFYLHFSYRDMAKKGGHGCLTEGHEVLTRQGWKKISEVTDQEEIAVWSHNAITFETPSHWERKSWTGTLHTWEGTSLSIQMTSDHRVIYYKDQRYLPAERPAEAGPSGYIPLGSNYIGGSIDMPGRLIAAFQSDGHQKSAGVMEFHFHKERKKERLIQLCKLYNYRYKETLDKILVYGELPKKAGAYMLDWTAESLADFLDEYKQWDGHITATSVTLFSTDKTQLEWLQTLGRLLGIGGNIQKPQISGFGSTTYRLMQNNRKFATAKSIQTSTKNVEAVIVHCPTVSSGAFLIRRNGKISVTGNTNYYGTPRTMAMHLKVLVALIEHFQNAYFEAFPGIREYHRWVAQQIQINQYLETPLGMGRHFFGRPGDDTTLREGIAFIPQSGVGQLLNLALWRNWKYMRHVDRLGQIHDAIVIQYWEKDEEEVLTKAVTLMPTPLYSRGREFTIPSDVMIGWNWKKFHGDKNPDGLIKWAGNDKRTRQFDPASNGLDRLIT